jgi:hypothetical protein
MIWTFFLDYLFLSFFSIRCVGQGCLPCRCISKVKGCPNSFWVLFWCFTQRPSYLFCFFFSLIKISTLACFFQHNPHVGFWETLRPRFFQLPKGCFGVPINLFPHFLWGDQFHFHIGHCFSHLFNKLGIHCTYHWH